MMDKSAGTRPACIALWLMLCWLATGSVAASEVILSVEELNETLKQMQRIRRDIDVAVETDRPELYFQLAKTADDLALVLTNEVIVNDMQQERMIDLALKRTEQLGIRLLWYPAKDRFIYDGAAFRTYLKLAPDGPRAGESAFQLLEIQFFQANGNDGTALQAAAEQKRDYLQHYADHVRAPEVGILLAIDYRDLWRLSRENEDQEATARYRDLTHGQFQWVIENHPGTKPAEISAGLLRRFEGESTGG